MRVSQVYILICLPLLLAGSNDARAEEPYRPAETPAPRPAPGADSHEIVFLGVRHASPLGKPCLEMVPSSRAHLVNQEVYDYVVAINNKCPRMIKVRICYKGSFDCNSARIHSYQSQELIMGFGPKTDRFNLTAKEDP
ncbi:hypothetical protein CU048_11360 [Beijerinckiaceae bacterium]|nr:hypothetical protein CU048_11360 [Beijerinckiaceae bacterium]